MFIGDNTMSSIPSVSIPSASISSALPVHLNLAADTLRSPEHHAASVQSPVDQGSVNALIGLSPSEAVEYVTRKTGVHLPANLGQDVDTTA